MDFQTLENGSQKCADDPGEPTTGKPRISITREEGQLLAWLARDKRVLEIGTGLGISTEWMWMAPASWLDTVDIDPWVHTNIHSQYAGKGAIRCYKNRDALPKPKPYDMVFIDASHTTHETLADIAFAESVCTRGVIAVHDAKIPEVAAALYGDFGIVPTTHGIGLKFIGWDA